MHHYISIECGSHVMHSILFMAHIYDGIYEHFTAWHSSFSMFLFHRNVVFRFCRCVTIIVRRRRRHHHFYFVGTFCSLHVNLNLSSEYEMNINIVQTILPILESIQNAHNIFLSLKNELCKSESRKIAKKHTHTQSYNRNRLATVARAPVSCSVFHRRHFSFIWQMSDPVCFPLSILSFCFVLLHSRFQ